MPLGCGSATNCQEIDIPGKSDGLQYRKTEEGGLERNHPASWCKLRHRRTTRVQEVPEIRKTRRSVKISSCWRHGRKASYRRRVSHESLFRAFFPLTYPLPSLVSYCSTDSPVCTSCPSCVIELKYDHGEPCVLTSVPVTPTTLTSMETR